MSLQKMIDAALTKNVVSVHGATFTNSAPDGRVLERSKTPVDFTVGVKLDLSAKNGASVQYVVTSSRPLTKFEKDAVLKSHVGLINKDVEAVVADYNKKNGTNVKIQKNVQFKVGKVNNLSSTDGGQQVAVLGENSLQGKTISANQPKVGVRV